MFRKYTEWDDSTICFLSGGWAVLYRWLWSYDDAHHDHHTLNKLSLTMIIDCREYTSLRSSCIQLSIYPSIHLSFISIPSIHRSYLSIYLSISSTYLIRPYIYRLYIVHISIYSSFYLSIFQSHIYICMKGLPVKWDGWLLSDRILWSPQCRRPITAYLWMMPSGRYIGNMVSYHIIFIYLSINHIYLWWAW